MVVVTQYLKYRFLLNKVIIIDVIIFSLLIKIFRFVSFLVSFRKVQ